VCNLSFAISVIRRNSEELNVPKVMSLQDSKCRNLRGVKGMPTTERRKGSSSEVGSSTDEL
jgi:hypothetical protein